MTQQLLCPPEDSQVSKVFFNIINNNGIETNIHHCIYKAGTEEKLTCAAFRVPPDELFLFLKKINQKTQINELIVGVDSCKDESVSLQRQTITTPDYLQTFYFNRETGLFFGVTEYETINNTLKVYPTKWSHPVGECYDLREIETLFFNYKRVEH